MYDAGTGEEKKALFFSGNVEALAWVEVAEEGGKDVCMYIRVDCIQNRYVHSIP